MNMSDPVETPGSGRQPSDELNTLLQMLPVSGSFEAAKIARRIKELAPMVKRNEVRTAYTGHFSTDVVYPHSSEPTVHLDESASTIVDAEAFKMGLYMEAGEKIPNIPVLVNI